MQMCMNAESIDAHLKSFPIHHFTTQKHLIAVISFLIK